MKIIFSRKGFDSSAGGWPSPIFEDNSVLSIPIPDSYDKCKYSMLPHHFNGTHLSTIVNDLTKRRYKKKGKTHQVDYSGGDLNCHWDPVIQPDFGKYALGQAGNSERELIRGNVGEGDIFLFFGWFRKVEQNEGKWRYVKSTPDIHLVWSWMKCAETIELSSEKQYAEARLRFPQFKNHPHMDGRRKAPNRLYVSEMGGLLPYSIHGCLTDIKEYSGRSKWRLPECFNQQNAFTRLKNFEQSGKEVTVTYKGFGQEFILDLEKVEDPLATNQIKKHISNVIGEPL